MNRNLLARIAQLCGAMLPGAVVLLALSIAGCGEQSTAPASDEGLLPADPEARAEYCYLILTLTIDQMAELDGPGRQRGAIAPRGADELLRARARFAAALDADLLEDLRRDPWPGLEAILAEFDVDGDGQLATAVEVDAFNRHVAACRNTVP